MRWTVSHTQLTYTMRIHSTCTSQFCEHQYHSILWCNRTVNIDHRHHFEQDLFWVDSAEVNGRLGPILRLLRDCEPGHFRDPDRYHSLDSMQTNPQDFHRDFTWNVCR